MKQTLSRPEVFALIDGERAYQDARWVGSEVGQHNHTPQEWLTYIADYTAEALHIGCREADEVAFDKQMAIMRKIAALGVAAMENLGAPPRTDCATPARSSQCQT
jgi:hypothetical protein